MLTICLSDNFKVIQALCDLKIKEFKEEMRTDSSVVFSDLGSHISTVSGGGGVDKFPRESECNKELTHDHVRVSSSRILSEKE